MAHQFEDLDGNLIAPITYANAVYMTKQSGHTLQEQVDYMTAGIMRDQYDGAKREILSLENPIISAIDEAGGTCKQEIASLVSSTNEIDNAAFPLKLSYVINGVFTDGSYEKNIVGTFEEYDDVEPNLTSVWIEKKINNGPRKRIYESDSPTASINVTDVIESKKETLFFHAETDRKTYSSSTDRYLCFCGAKVYADIVRDEAVKLTKSLRTASSFSTTIKTNRGEYIWLIIPDDLRITRVTSGGIEVKLVENEQGELNPKLLYITTFGYYYAYRTANALDENTWPLVVTMTTTN